VQAKDYIEGERRKSGHFYISCWISQEIKERLNRIKEKEGVSRAAIMRAALLAFFEAYEKEEAENESRSLPPRNNTMESHHD
jgi:uncharacterized hydantoinase/oxoprolinase family protein